MKTCRLKDLLKKDLLIIELPENNWLSVFPRLILICDRETNEYHHIKGSYTLLGSPDEIKKKDAMELVEESNEIPFTVYNAYFGDGYKNYKDKNSWFSNPVKSLLSALESEIFWENPHGKEEPNKSYFLDDKGSFLRQEKKQWHKSQEKTFDKKRVKIFVKN